MTISSVQISANNRQAVLKMLSVYVKNCAARRKKLIICVVLLLVSCVTILQTDLSPDLYFLTWDTSENVSCHYSTEGDALPAIDNRFNPTKSIHFHETSCRGQLNSRQACAVESAAKTHPDWQINLFFLGPISAETLGTGSLKALKKYENIKFLRIHLVDYAKGTPLENMISSGGLNRTRWRISHTSDALRYLTLSKWSGIYLDLDVVVAKSLEGLARNWAARESSLTVSAGALSFSNDEMGRLVAEAAIRDFKKNFRGDVWGHNGPGVITRILQKICNADGITHMSAATCQGIEVYGPELFYPVSWHDAADYFSDKELHVGDPYVYHVWNKLTENLTLKRNAPYSKLAKKYCPIVYETYGDNFGS